jgi:hypothetical protein
MIADARVPNALRIDAPLLATFVLHVEPQHDDRAPYHNMCHVFNVVRMLCIFVGWPEVRSKLDCSRADGGGRSAHCRWVIDLDMESSTFEIGADFDVACA